MDGTTPSRRLPAARTVRRSSGGTVVAGHVVVSPARVQRGRHRPDPADRSCGHPRAAVRAAAHVRLPPPQTRRGPGHARRVEFVAADRGGDGLARRCRHGVRRVAEHRRPSGGPRFRRIETSSGRTVFVHNGNQRGGPAWIAPDDLGDVYLRALVDDGLDGTVNAVAPENGATQPRKLLDRGHRFRYRSRAEYRARLHPLLKPANP